MLAVAKKTNFLRPISRRKLICLTRKKEITVFLVDRASKSEFALTKYTKEVMFAIRNRITTFMERVCKDTAYTAQVTWDKRKPSDTDIVVYVFYSPVSSIIAARGHEARHTAETGGTFKDGEGMISEIFLKPMDGAASFVDVTANIIFHEIMHNKLDCSPPGGPEDIHTGGGGGLAAATISAKSVLTDGNAEAMAAQLDKKVPQFRKKMKNPKY